MSSNIRKAIETIKEEVLVTKKLTEEYIFGIVGFKYFFNEGEFSKSDYKNSFVDGRSDGGIDLIATSESENGEGKNLILIQSKYGENVSNEDVKNVFVKIAQTIENFKNHEYSQYSKKLKRIFLNKYEDTKDESSFNIELVLFLGKKFFLNESRIKIENELKKIESLKNYTCSIYDKQIIEQQIEKLEEDKKYVKESKIKIFQKDGIITRNTNGILVNISANSLKDLYSKYKDEGLFEQNFRYYIKAKKIDDQINKSLKEKRKEFWFLNNGIIIGCQDFRMDGDIVKLYNFSIVNGCQTVTLIGKYSETNAGDDFAITCKIVKPPKNKEDFEGTGKEKDKEYNIAFNDFITDIAEASNSQKPIKDRDLKANAQEQRKLQKFLKDESNGIPIVQLEIKRGETFPKLEEKWRKIKNEEYGQLFLAFALQKPGTARNSKNKVFSSKETYNDIFKREPSLELHKMTADLLKISNLYKKFADSDDYFGSYDDDSQINDVIHRGKFFIIAIIGFLVKYNRKFITLPTDGINNSWQSKLCKDNIVDGIFKDNLSDNFEEEILFPLFSLMIKLIFDSYEKSKLSSVSNFLKVDKRYYEDILRDLTGKLGNNLEKDPWEKGRSIFL